MRHKAEFIVEFNNRDPAAFKKMHTFFYRRFYSMSWQITRNQEESRIIVTDSLTNVFLKKDKTLNDKKFKDVKELEGYVYMAVRNASITYYRQQQSLKRNTKDLRWITDESYEMDGCANADRELPELIERIMAVIEQMPRQRKKVAKLKILEGYTIRQVADEMKITISMVHQHLDKALKALQREVGDYIYFDPDDWEGPGTP